MTGSTEENAPRAQALPLVSFDAVAAPRVSVIILAWQLTSQLLECLAALRDSRDAPEFEVILVLNGAADGTRRIVRDNVSGAEVVDLEANIGFGGGCNRGAAVARGEYLLFLNDDAVVHPLCLRALVSTADLSPTTGAVGAVLLNLDGTVQEAGSRVLADAGTVPFGAGLPVEDAASAGYLQSRDVDYASGAALLVRRSAFTQVDGFDRLFEPAYYEDVDLCFRLRTAGWGIRLAPDAKAVHASGASTESMRRFRTFAGARSGSRFIARWEAVLAHAPAADAPLAELCEPERWAPETVRASPHPPATALAIALDIVTAYAAWLSRHLDEAEQRLAEETARSAAEAERATALQARADLVQHRLHELEQRSPLGLLRWQAGLIVSRRRERSGR